MPISFGRLTLGNVHGSGRHDRSLPAVMQYRDGPAQGLKTDGDDSCTRITVTDVGADATLTDDETRTVDPPSIIARSV